MKAGKHAVHPCSFNEDEVTVLSVLVKRVYILTLSAGPVHANKLKSMCEKTFTTSQLLVLQKKKHVSKCRNEQLWLDFN